MLNGHGPITMALDSGGVVSLLDTRFVQSQNLPKRGSIRLGMGGREGIFDTVTADLVVGNALRISNMLFGSTSRIQFGANIVGSLGAGFLTNGASELDFDQSVWRFLSTGITDLPGYTRLPSAIVKGRSGTFLFVDAMLNGVGVRLAVDTGYPSMIRLTPAAQSRTGLDRSGLATRPQTVRGHPAGSAVYCDRTQIGGIDLGRTIVARANRANPVFQDGLLGLALLRQLNMVINPARGELWIRRNGLAGGRDDGSPVEL